MITSLAILASGNGSNAENIVRFFMSSPDVNVSLILTNSQKAFALQRARNLGIPCAYFSKEFWQDGHAILNLLQSYQIGFVVLAGFLAKIPDVILQAYPHRMINIHPSLLPLHGGKGIEVPAQAPRTDHLPGSARDVALHHAGWHRPHLLLAAAHHRRDFQELEDTS